MKILIVRTDHLGDVLLTTPLIRALNKAGHDVTIAIQRSLLPVFQHSPYVRALALEDSAPDFPRRWRALCAWMRGQDFDALLLPHPYPRRLLLASLFSGISKRLTLASGIWGRATLHRCLRSGFLQAERHYADAMLEFARALGVTPDGLTPDIFLTAEERASARGAITSRFGHAPIVIVHPGTAGNTCNPRPQFYAELVEKILARTNAAIVCTGTTAEKKLLAEWPDHLLRSPRLWNAMGETNLRELAAHIACATGIIVPSTGPLHLAHALGIPSISPACQHPPVSLKVWGNLHPDAAAAGPTTDYCTKWRRKHPGHQHCCMDGQLDSESLWPHIATLLAHDTAHT